MNKLMEKLLSRRVRAARVGWVDPLGFLAQAVRHRRLIRRLAIQQVRSRYAGSVLGVVWAVVHPIFLLAVFTFVFSVIFQARWGTEVHARGHFALVLFAGLLVYNLFQHCLIHAPMILVGRPSYVTKMVFPLDVLPWVTLAEAVFNAIVGFMVFFVLYGVILGVPPLTTLAVPVLLIPLMLFILGMMWVLAAAGVYVRDLAQVVNVVALVAMFLSPIFYPLEAIPDRFRVIILMSPLTIVITHVRGAVFDGVLPSPGGFVLSLAVGWCVAWFGFVCFCLLRRGFGDVV
jgi:lipopolysaccharide transport system permease protein